jgi:Na+/melibiose symporter-like transporter
VITRGARAAGALQSAAMTFLRRHNRALACIAGGLLLGALTYQPPV